MSYMWAVFIGQPYVTCLVLIGPRSKKGKEKKQTNQHNLNSLKRLWLHEAEPQSLVTGKSLSII